MSNDTNEYHLGVIANLLAFQIIQDKSLVDASWMLARAGMKYTEIGQILGISVNSVSAHISNKRKQLDKTTGVSTKAPAKKANNE